jgi:hypothetical protein
VPLNYARRHPSAVLLVVQLAAFLLYPLMEKSPQSRMLFGVFGLLVLGLVLRVIRKTAFTTWVGWLLAAPVVLLAAVSLFVPRSPELMGAIAAFEAAVYFYAAGSLITHILEDQVATTDDLFAAGATFTLLAWAFAYVFMSLQEFNPGSFGIPGTPTMHRSWMELLYLSVMVLSSVGLSDVVPGTPFARGLVMLEGFIGVFYMALVVSRLIGLLAAKRERATHEVRRVPPP